jgi:transcriptional regulator with XRE-family HTH domain
MKLFGRRVRAGRIATGFNSAEDFADAVGMGCDRYAAIENGTLMPDLAELALIASTTNRSIHYMVTGKFYDGLLAA